MAWPCAYPDVWVIMSLTFPSKILFFFSCFETKEFPETDKDLFISLLSPSYGVNGGELRRSSSNNYFLSLWPATGNQNSP